MSDGINIGGVRMDERQLAPVCVHHRIKALRLFGSVIRQDFRPDSDVDVLVEFEPGIDPDLFKLGEIQQDLTDLFGRIVDLKTPEMFRPSGLQRVLRTSRLGYAA